MTLIAPFACAALLALSSAAPSSRAPLARDAIVRRSGAETRVEFTVSWANAWRNERNHDAAWIVLRSPDARRGPLRLAAAGHAATGAVPAEIVPSEDRLGAFVAPAKPHRGAVEWRVSLVVAEDAPEPVTPWAVGMVLVPGGPFELGDDDPVAVRFGAFHRAGGGPLRVESEAEIRVGSEPGSLSYQRDKEGYRGDGGGPIPEAWPKGTRPFYVMKHELVQGEYAAFIGALPPEWRARRAPLSLKGEETGTCSIRLEGDRCVALAPERPCNFVSWDDTCALYDWLALRPITEFEFEKAARGPRRPVPHDYPWGTASAAGLARQVRQSRDLSEASVEAEAALTDETRPRLGASHYWVMDLAGSVWERVVSAGHPAGRAFRGTHGDGVLSAEGLATNEDWPKTAADGGEAPGLGFRGGAEYFAPQPKDNPTNPHSPVALRTYAGWGGAERYKTYSARAGRSAPASE